MCIYRSLVIATLILNPNCVRARPVRVEATRRRPVHNHKRIVQYYDLHKSTSELCNNTCELCNVTSELFNNTSEMFNITSELPLRPPQPSNLVIVISCCAPLGSLLVSCFTAAVDRCYHYKKLSTRSSTSSVMLILPAIPLRQ